MRQRPRRHVRQVTHEEWHRRGRWHRRCRHHGMANRPARAWILATVLGAACALLIGACARTPTGPSVMVLAGAGKTLDEFHRDDDACRQTAAQELQNTKGGEVPAQRRYDIAYMQCMYAKGHQIPVPGTRPSGNASGNQSAPSASPGPR